MMPRSISILLCLTLLAACTSEPAQRQPLVQDRVVKVTPPKPLLQRCGPTPAIRKPKDGWEAADIYLDWKDYALKCQAKMDKLVDWYE